MTGDLGVDSPEPAGDGALVVRDATPADVEQVLAFVHALARFEREPEAVRATRDDYLRDGFGPDPAFGALLAHVGPRPAGLALWFRTYSTWEGRPGLWLEDLWVEPWARSRGIGRALVAGLAARAVACGWARLDLSVLDWNPARDFYDRLGFRELAAWRPYRLEGERLRALARELAATTSGDGPASG